MPRTMPQRQLGPDNNVLPNTLNKAPVFEDQDDEMEGDQTAQERTDRGEHRRQP